MSTKLTSPEWVIDVRFRPLVFCAPVGLDCPTCRGMDWKCPDENHWMTLGETTSSGTSERSALKEARLWSATSYQLRSW